MESSLRIVAITNCPAGIAHTYMVAEALEQKAVLSPYHKSGNSRVQWR